jgi:hypothetical protein
MLTARLASWKEQVEAAESAAVPAVDVSTYPALPKFRVHLVLERR